MRRKVALPVPERFTRPNHNLSDMNVAVIKADLGEQIRKRGEELRFIFNNETLALSGLSQDFAFS